MLNKIGRILMFIVFATLLTYAIVNSIDAIKVMVEGRFNLLSMNEKWAIIFLIIKNGLIALASLSALFSAIRGKGKFVNIILSGVILAISIGYYFYYKKSGFDAMPIVNMIFLFIVPGVYLGSSILMMFK